MSFLKEEKHLIWAEKKKKDNATWRDSSMYEDYPWEKDLREFT